MVEAVGDATPCRWAIAQKVMTSVKDGLDDKPTIPKELVDLTPHAQVSRGQELLQLLWEPTSPSPPASTNPAQDVIELESLPVSANPAPDVIKPEEDTDEKMQVKNTFIELVRSQCQRNLKRSQSDPAIAKLQKCDELPISASELATDLQDLHTQFNTCPGDNHYQQTKGEFLDPFAGCAMQAQVEDQWLSMDASIDNGCSKVSGHSFHSLNACTSNVWSQEYYDVVPELSDASTDTPRESVEDFSMRDMYDAAPYGEIIREADADQFGHISSYAAGSKAYYDNAAWNYLAVGHGSKMTQHSMQLDAASISTQNPMSRSTAYAKGWQQPSDWSATLHSEGAPIGAKAWAPSGAKAWPSTSNAKAWASPDVGLKAWPSPSDWSNTFHCEGAPMNS